MNPKFLRALIVGNLTVYGVIGALILYFYFFPADGTTEASSNPGLGNNSPFLSIIIPTPTELAPLLGNGNITPIPIDTPAPAEMPPTAQGAGNAPTPVPAGAPPPTTAPVKDRGLVPPTSLNIILMGTDQRAPTQRNWRTDTLILVSVNQEDKSVGLLSIPRDLWVQIPGIGSSRINTADFYGEYYHLPGGGPVSVKRTIEANLGVRVHYYVRVGFDAFRKAIDTLGGVDVDVNCPLQERGFYDDYGRADLNFLPGMQHMDGVTALRYARSRYTTNDYDRGRRQRQVLVAMWDKTLSLDLLPKWPELYGQFRESVQTDLGPVELAALAWIGSQLHMDRIKSRAIDNRVATPWIGPAGEWVLLPQPQRIHAALVEFFTPTPRETDTAFSEKARIGVTSGNKQTADITAVNLKRQGFDVVESKATSTLAPASSILVYRQKLATVQRLVNALHLNPSSVRTVSDPAATVDLQVVLGRDYNACQR